MARPLLPLCSIPKLALRDGYTGAAARLFLPFYANGYWFPSGQILTFPNATIAQDTRITMTGTNKPNTFQKDCCSCF